MPRWWLARCLLSVFRRMCVCVCVSWLSAADSRGLCGWQAGAVLAGMRCERSTHERRQILERIQDQNETSSLKLTIHPRQLGLYTLPYDCGIWWPQQDDDDIPSRISKLLVASTVAITQAGPVTAVVGERERVCCRRRRRRRRGECATAGFGHQLGCIVTIASIARTSSQASKLPP